MKIFWQLRETLKSWGIVHPSVATAVSRDGVRLDLARREDTVQLVDTSSVSDLSQLSSSKEIKEAQHGNITDVEKLTKMNDILSEVLAERERQDKKWGEQNHPMGTGGECLERLADMRKADCDFMFSNHKGTWRHILLEEVAEALAELPGPKMREELIQTAAVVVAMIECYDRNGGRKE